jgi:hypothetical protein
MNWTSCYNEETFKLTIPQTFNDDLINLPTNTQILVFDEVPGNKARFSEFNKQLNTLPDSITFIKFGSLFNQEINNLPKNLKTLIFGYEFNQSVALLPKTLTTLTFGYYFNHPINGRLFCYD